ILDTMITAADRGGALVRQLLTFARGSNQGRQPIQLRHLLRDLIAFATATFPKTISLTTHIPGDLWLIHANPVQIHQVLLNLCVNARDASPRDGQIVLTAKNRVLDAAAAGAITGGREGNFVSVEIRDFGTGIPPEVLARIWEPFFTTKGENKGTGLGLPTVREIIQRHAGFVSVETKVGHGTAF